MKISLRHHGDYIVEFDQVKVGGRFALSGFAITFSFRGNRRACNAPLAFSNMSLAVSADNQAGKIATHLPSSETIIQCCEYPNTSEQLHFETIFSKEQINALEQYRQAGDLKLNVGLKALVTAGEEVSTSYEHEDISIPREQWLDALNSAGFRQTLLFEVELPDTEKELVTLLNKAQDFINTGHYQDAVLQCRHIIEGVEALRQDKHVAKKANDKAHSNDRKDMTAIERMLSLREQLKNICQLGAHGPSEFTRSQAKMVLGFTMALLAEPTVGTFENK